jgi:hypothetical protein
MSKKKKDKWVFQISGGDYALQLISKNRRRGRQFAKLKSVEQRLVLQKTSNAGGSISGLGRHSGRKLGGIGPEQNGAKQRDRLD